MTISKTSRDLLKLSLVTSRPFRCPGCICLTLQERLTLRRVSRIVGKLKRQVRRQARAEAQARLTASGETPQG
jgi:hypothetical protein